MSTGSYLCKFCICIVAFVFLGWSNSPDRHGLLLWSSLPSGYNGWSLLQQAGTHWGCAFHCWLACYGCLSFDLPFLSTQPSDCWQLLSDRECKIWVLRAGDMGWRVELFSHVWKMMIKLSDHPFLLQTKKFFLQEKILCTVVTIWWVVGYIHIA